MSEFQAFDCCKMAATTEVFKVKKTLEMALFLSCLINLKPRGRDLGALV